MPDIPYVFDGHNDLLSALRITSRYQVAGLDGSRPELHTDLPRLRAGGVGAQFWSVYVPAILSAEEAVVAVLEQIDAYDRLLGAYPDQLVRARTADDVERAAASGRIASLLGAEGGHSFGGSAAVLRILARLGVRYVTLTHNDNLPWADSATDREQSLGLTATGRAFIAEFNRLGVLADLSHTSERTQVDAIEASTAPVLFSHSSARAVNGHPRNVSDAVLSLLPANGGVVQVTFVPPFVSAAVWAWQREHAQFRHDAGIEPVAEPWPEAPDPLEERRLRGTAPLRGAPSAEADPREAEWLAAHPRPRATIADVVAHIEHIREVAGVAHIGLGGDYDGIDVQPEGLEDVSGYPRLFRALTERGWSEDELVAIAHGNVLRVLRAADDVAEATAE